MRILQDQPDAAPNPEQATGVVGEVLQERSFASKPALSRGAYQLRFAESREDLEAAFRLRFIVFNLELNEGLESAYATGYDTDEFDKTCDHLIVEHHPSRQVDRKSTRLNSSHVSISYAVFCLKKKKT